MTATPLVVGILIGASLGLAVFRLPAEPVAISLVVIALFLALVFVLPIVRKFRL